MTTLKCKKTPKNPSSQNFITCENIFQKQKRNKNFSLGEKWENPLPADLYYNVKENSLDRGMW